MATVTKLGYWAGSGTVNDPYKPDFASRYTLTGWHQRSGRAVDGVVMALFDGDTTAINEIAADAGVIPDSAKLPAPEPNTLEMPNREDDVVALAAALPSGGTLELAQGVYEIAKSWSVPANITIQPAAGARVVLVDTDGGAPNIALNGGTILRNLWVGGNNPATNENGVQMGSGCLIEGCVFFNFFGCIIEGQGTSNTYRDNVFINCGTPGLYHALYITGDMVSLRKDALVEGNLFLSNKSYACTLYHKPTHCTIRRNLFARNRWAISDDGSSHVIENNAFWSGIGLIMNSLSATTIYRNNVIGYGAPPLSAFTAGAQVSGNYYIENTVCPSDTAPVSWRFEDARQQLGRTHVHIEAALDAIESAFIDLEDMSTLYTDGTVDYYLDILRELTDWNSGT
jgi:hypothetical protein